MITIYSTPTCSKCKMIKITLENKNIEYEEKDITKDHKAFAKMISNGYKTVPIIEINEILYSGEPKELLDKIKELNGGQ